MVIGINNMVELVRNEEKYWDFIRVTRNLNNGFVDQVEITPEQQATYMEKHNDDYFVLLVNSVPVGFVGVIDYDIRVAVAPEHRGKGYAKIMISKLVDHYPTYELNAKVLVSNEASNKLFLSCGYTMIYSNNEFNHYAIIYK